MSGKIDENDRLRAGTLGADPFADAPPMAKVGQAHSEKEPVPEADPFAGLARVVPIGLPPPAPREEPIVATPTAEPVLLPTAYHGLLGEIVHAIEPHSEAHPAAILVQLLVATLNMIGRGPHFAVGATTHYLVLFAVIVGKSAKARKGGSWDEAHYLVRRIDPQFASERIASGLVSGEGLVYQVRDDKFKNVHDPETKELKQELVEEGVRDKRLLVQEAEFGRVLQQLGRDGNTLSPILRCAWDCADLVSLSRHHGIRATAPHVSLVGHITEFELRLRMSANEAQNGLANRILWTHAHRTRLLPSGGSLPDAARDAFVERLREVVDFAATVGRMKRDAAGEALWEKIYHALGTETHGLLGSITARAEGQCMRLACGYALLDRSAVVRAAHLRAAVALWLYCAQSARRVFGDSLGDADLDALAAALRAAGPAGMTRTEIRDHFKRHRSRQVATSASLLVSSGLARVDRETTTGRPVERLVWIGARDVEDVLRDLLAEVEHGDHATEGTEAPERADGVIPTRHGRAAAAKHADGHGTRRGDGAPEAIEARPGAETIGLFDRVARDPHRQGEL